MNDDLDYVRQRIPTYRGYADEPSRHDSDKRVRAIVGEALSDAHVRFGLSFDAATSTAFDELLMQCMFTDQTIVRRLEHAKLDEPAIAALGASDRVLVELEEDVMNASSVEDLGALIQAIREQFRQRHAPTQLAG
jgi:hypothetical protein